MSTEKVSLKFNYSDPHILYGSSGSNGLSAIDGSTNNRPQAKSKYRIDNFLPCDPRRWMHRFLMLCLMCSLSFGKRLKKGKKHENVLSYFVDVAVGWVNYSS